MPGLGGQGLSQVHADETAKALVAIQPDFIRLRSTAVIPHTPLAKMQADGQFQPCTEVGMVAEIKRFLMGLGGLKTRLESDHMLNLLMEVHGNLPEDLPRLLDICDDFLALPEKSRWVFVLARRKGWMGTLEEFADPQIKQQLTDRLGVSPSMDLAALAAELRTRMV